MGLRERDVLDCERALKYQRVLDEPSAESDQPRRHALFPRLLVSEAEIVYVIATDVRTGLLNHESVAFAVYS